MESGVPNSFIPQDATIASSGVRRSSAGLGELVLLIAIVSLIASIATGVGVFLYSQYLAQQSVSKQEQLQRAKDAFDPAVIEKYTQLDDRMNVASSIMKNHIAPSALFAALDQLTLKTVSFQSFVFDASDPTKITIKATGVARSVNSIAFEADILGTTNSIIKNPIFSGINRGIDGVDFDLTAEVDPADINYSQLNASNGLPVINPTNGGVASTTTSVVPTQPQPVTSTSATPTVAAPAAPTGTQN